MQHDSHPRRFVVSPTGDLVLPADLLADLGLSANEPVEVTPTKTGFSVTRQVPDPSPAFEEALASALIDFHVTLEILRKGGPIMDPIYLTAKELGALNAASLQDTVQESTVRSASALDSIIAQPQQVFFSTEAYPTAEKKLGIVFLKIITLHPFEDGNKRTAVLALAVLAKLNHYRITYTNSELAALTLKIAAADGPDIDYDALYKNLRVHLAPANN